MNKAVIKKTGSATDFTVFKAQALAGPAYIKSDIINHIGVITLDRPQALNALHPYMMYTLRHTLSQWQDNLSVHAVIIRSSCERAFSAGGDLRAVYDAHKAGDTELLSFLFQEEYQLDFLVHTFPKPYISFIDGLVMGGGMGISINGPYRLMSERITAAMPETKIGFFPDAGATQFLQKCPGFVGLYLALTGNTCNTADALYGGLGTHFVPHHKQSELYYTLLSLKTDNPDDANTKIYETLKPYSHHPQSLDNSFLAKNQKAIDRFFRHSSCQGIIDHLTHASQDITDPDHVFAMETLSTLNQRSPTSLMVTYEQFKRGAMLTSFKDIMECEYGLACHFLRHHDFIEGIRSLIIDKDQNPNWSPHSLKDVTPDSVESYFEPLDHTLFP